MLMFSEVTKNQNVDAPKEPSCVPTNILSSHIVLLPVVLSQLLLVFFFITDHVILITAYFRVWNDSGDILD